MRLRSTYLLLATLVGATACGRTETKPPSAPVAPPTADSTFCLAEEHSSLEKNATKDALLALDTLFLKAHTRARAEECRRIESERLVLRFSFGRLDARYKGTPLFGGPVDVLQPEFHLIKDISHGVFFAGLLFEDRSKDAAAHAANALPTLDAAIKELHDGTSAAAKRIPAALVPAQERILGATRDAVASFAEGKLDAAGQKAFFDKVRPDILANLRAVSGGLVRGLDAAVKRVRAEVASKDPKAWENVVVLVTVSHQARARDIGVQYFERLLGEPQTEGAKNERRLVVSEGLFKPAQQYGLYSAHVVDQVGSAQVFDDPLRLQWDVLADDGGVLESILPR